MFRSQLELIDRYDRPTVELYGVNALIDPGSVWLIIDSTPEAIKELFGGSGTGIMQEVQGIAAPKVPGEIYILEHFCMGDMVFKNFPAMVAPIADNEISMMIGCSMYGGGTRYTIDTEANTIVFEYPELFFAAKKPVIRRNGEWKRLDFINGNLVAYSAI